MSDDNTASQSAAEHGQPIVMPSVFVEKMKSVVGHLESAQTIMSSGPLSYYFVKLVEHSEALLTRFAPLKVGSKAVISGKIKCTGGWSGSEKNLAIGQEGTVQSVDYREGQWVYEFVPDRQWYRYDGEWIEKEQRSFYCLCGDVLKSV